MKNSKQYNNLYNVKIRVKFDHNMGWNEFNEKFYNLQYSTYIEIFNNFSSLEPLVLNNSNSSLPIWMKRVVVKANGIARGVYILQFKLLTFIIIYRVGKRIDKWFFYVDNIKIVKII